MKNIVIYNNIYSTEYAHHNDVNNDDELTRYVILIIVSYSQFLINIFYSTLVYQYLTMIY